MAYKKIDESASRGADDIYLTRVYRLDSGKTVRVRVRRNAYAAQSHAVAEVLNADLKWTDLVSEPTDSWHVRVGPAVTQPSAVMASVADTLIRRAENVLDG